ncbi:MAG TPA: response regulator, partial [Magnetospirillaceae bacterium]|nr:response regulator [Magnetospirillaceae bacterium]
MRCLLIEDEPETARYIVGGLALAGISVTWVADGAAGLTRAREESWDVIILDRMLPGDLDGLSVLDSLRRGGGRMPVLVLSALASLDERVSGLRGGADDYLTK